MPTEPLPKVEINPPTKPTASVILLHGLGADGNDFVDIVSELKLPANLPTRFIFPHAPVRPVTINGGYAMRAWYDIKAIGVKAQEDETGIREAEQAISQLIQHEIDQGIPAERIILAGFSQGGAIALQCGLRYNQRLGGILALSTYVPLPSHLSSEVSQTNKTTPIFMAHGTTDNVVAFAFGQASSAFLQKLGCNVEFHSYPMPHSVCPQEIADISNWLQKILAK